MTEIIQTRDSIWFHPIQTVDDVNLLSHYVATSQGTVDVNEITWEATEIDINDTQISTNIELQEKLRSKWPAVLERARELESIYPDPIKAMIDLMDRLPGDPETLRYIFEKPYG